MREEPQRRKQIALPLLAAILMVTGLGLVLYPHVEAYLQDQRELALIANWSASSTATQTSAKRSPENSAAAALLPKWKTVDGVQLLGTLEIDGIDLKEPIVNGANADSLKRGAGSVVDGRLPGESGNFVLAGHRSLTFGRHFNRLGELKNGDSIILDTSAGRYVYHVTGTSIVDPDDVSVLNNSAEGAPELTLITCHPRKNPTHRLIVKARLIAKPQGTGDL